MTEFRIKIAGCVAAVTAIYESCREFCEGYLTDETPDFSVEITASDIEFEREKSIKTRLVEGLGDTALPDAQLEVTAIQRKIAERLFGWNTILFHGSAIAVDGAVYLFTAKSGTGKSTHARLWRQMLGDRAVMVNDDKPFLCMTGEGIMVCGSPWNGKHHLGSNICVPLKAICILERGEENRICRITAEEALLMLLQQSNRPAQARLMPKYLELMDKLARSAAFYRLQCNMELDAAVTSYEAMSKGQ